MTERTVNINGTPTNYVGEMVLVLDPDFQVKWAWDAFDHLDVNRGPVLGEVMLPGSPEPTAVVPLLPAVDWLHVNAVALSPADGNLILSVRHQDWVIKIDYRNGAGDGHVVWRLGQGGDFTLNSADPNAWFSHQHNAHYIDDHTLILFDNGNTRRASDPTANSRGQVWTLDETTMTATPVLNADLGNYSFRLGSAQRLSNGNYSFMSGSQGPVPNDIAQTIEVRPDGTPSYVLQFATPEYRSFRMRTLYEGIDDALAGAPQKVESVVINDGSAQRSMVNSITVTFGGAAVLDPGAIELRRQDGTPGGRTAEHLAGRRQDGGGAHLRRTGVRRRVAGGRQLHPDGPRGPGPRPLGPGTGRGRQRHGGRRPDGRLLPTVRRQRRRREGGRPRLAPVPGQLGQSRRPRRLSVVLRLRRQRRRGGRRPRPVRAPAREVTAGREQEATSGVLAAKQVPHCAAHSPRDEEDVVILLQTALAKELTIWLKYYFQSQFGTSSRRRPYRWGTSATRTRTCNPPININEWSRWIRCKP